MQNAELEGPGVGLSGPSRKGLRGSAPLSGFSECGLIGLSLSVTSPAWLTCGNTSEAALRQILARHLETALSLPAHGEDLVEISAP